MSRLEVPLQYRKLRATGDVLLRSELDLLLKDNARQWKADTFLVDSGTEMTTKDRRMNGRNSARGASILRDEARPGAAHTFHSTRLSSAGETDATGET
ncbi:MAG: hypothetical protein ACHRXM_05480 [Isosphaerales bacterium]